MRSGHPDPRDLLVFQREGLVNDNTVGCAWQCVPGLMHVIDSTAQQNSCLTCPADTPFSGRLATSAPINTTNRQAAATTAPLSYPGDLASGACPVLHQAYMMSKIDEIRVMSMNGAGASSGEIVSGAASAEIVSTHSSFDCTAGAGMLTRLNNS